MGERREGVVDDVWAKQELELICCVRVCIQRATRERELEREEEEEEEQQ